MSVRFTFGDRNHPTGNFSEAGWELMRPRAKQVRRDGIAEVKLPAQACGEVDAFWTRAKNIPLGITTADCVPLLLDRDDGKAIGAIHAGWEGTLLRIVPKFFEAVPEDLRKGEAWRVKIGPSIRACCYEFGDDLLKRFQDEFPRLDTRQMIPRERHLDLIAILRHEFEGQGVKIDFVDERCTFCTRDAHGSPIFFSYRRGDRHSRQYSIIANSESGVL